jgi:hypothetical protein
MTSFDAGAEYGIFVDVQATSAPISITAIKVAGALCTCFTSAAVQILTQSEMAAHGLSNNASAWSRTIVKRLAQGELLQ